MVHLAQIEDKNIVVKLPFDTCQRSEEEEEEDKMLQDINTRQFVEVCQRACLPANELGVPLVPERHHP